MPTVPIHLPGLARQNIGLYKGGADMALTINTNIKNDADGYLVDADAVKVAEGEMLNEALEKRPPVVVVSELPETPDPDTLYLIPEEGE